MRTVSLALGIALFTAPLLGQQAPAVGAAPVPPAAAAGLISTASTTYALRPGDILKVAVWGQEQFSGQFLIDETGHLQYPLLGDLQVSNLTVAQLRDRILQALEQIFKSPFVSVSPLFRMAVLGEVRLPGLYTVDPTLSVLDVVAMAGGPSPVGNLNKIRLLRGGQEQQLKLGQGHSLEDMGVRSGDQIIVGRKSFAREDLNLLLTLVSIGLTTVVLVNTVK